MTDKIERNSICRCGSGLKYKKCCLIKEIQIENERLKQEHLNAKKAQQYRIEQKRLKVETYEMISIVLARLASNHITLDFKKTYHKLALVPDIKYKFIDTRTGSQILFQDLIRDYLQPGEEKLITDFIAFYIKDVESQAVQTTLYHLSNFDFEKFLQR